MSTIATPVCYGIVELSSAAEERSRLNEQLSSGVQPVLDSLSPTSKHIASGLALTIGSALGELPPSREECLAAFMMENSAGLSAGARAWSKHAHRSDNHDESDPESTSDGWWGNPKGPITSLNARALELFDRIVYDASWKNLHWLPHMVLVYEVRVVEGYGMRWSLDQSPTATQREWIFRGFVEPMMENGHELRWRRYKEIHNTANSIIIQLMVTGTARQISVLSHALA